MAPQRARFLLNSAILAEHKSMVRAFLIIFVAAYAFSGLISATAQTSPDPDQPDTIFVDSVVAFTSGTGVVPIIFFNDEELSAIEITLKHSSPDVSIDSFSFAGGRLELSGAQNVFQLNGDTLITIASFQGPVLVPLGSGLAGKLFLSYDAAISPQVIPIDTVTWKIDELLEHTTVFRDTSEEFVPQYVRGYLNIQEAPAAMDSIWVDNVEGEPGNEVAVAVSSYNEWNVAEVAVALDYGSDLLHFDSISYLGSRSLSAAQRILQPNASLHTLYMRIIFDDALPLAPGSGLLGTIYFTVDPAAPETLIIIDSTSIGPAHTQVTLTNADGGIEFTPFFTAGSVDVGLSTGIEDVTPDGLLPADYDLAQNYPNPFNPATHIQFSLPRAGAVRLEVFNILGARVRQLVNQILPAGVHRVSFNGRSDEGRLLATGVYFYRLVTDEYAECRKMLLLK
jgi:hypothetical protein